MRVLLPLLVLLGLLGCGGIEKYGKADYYDHLIEEIDVVMPSGAPYISEQYRNDSVKRHLGIDVWAPLRTPILAAAPGVVKASFYEPGHGNQIVLIHGTDTDGAEILTVYKHLKDRQAEKGARVSRGQQIGTMGATGALAMLVHLHFETLKLHPSKGHVHSDPHLHWVEGIGRVTCFKPGKSYPDHPFKTTYPVPCKDQ
jgi:murein DD-endopeptidase MepM/ murein hydrolase activator NlpD